MEHFEGQKTVGFGGRRRLLGRRDWLCFLSLLVPLALYNLFSKSPGLVELLGEEGSFLAATFGLLRSDLLFTLGYALFWIGAFAVTREGLLRPAVRGLFVVVTAVVFLVSAGSQAFFDTTGSVLDLDTILFFITSPAEVWPVVKSEMSPTIVALLALFLLYFALVPWLLLRRFEDGPDGGVVSRPPWLVFAGMAILAFALFSFSAIPNEFTAGSASLAGGNAIVELVASEVERPSEQGPEVDVEAVRESLPTETSLAQTAETEKMNVVQIVLESTRAESVTPYNPEIETTPYLDELSERSLFAEEAYSVVPHTTNSLVASICGIDPPDRSGTDGLAEEIPANCLPELLGNEGYGTVFFQSPTEEFERRPEVVELMGYEEFYSEEDFSTEGFERANYFGYEDDIMLQPSREWLEENSDEPFYATYNTITPHHQYLAPDGSYGSERFSEDDTVNRYQNSVRYMDFFVKNIIEQYKEMGLYENTIFVIQGDHGEAFGEHGRSQHDNVIWNEGLQIPLMVLDPRKPEGIRVEEPVNELDILPTVADALGYSVSGGEYPGRSLLRPIPEDRTLYASCWYEEECAATIEGDEKYIYHFGDRPDEFYDLGRDPQEKNNLAGEQSPENLEARREDLLRWKAEVSAAYE